MYDDTTSGVHCISATFYPAVGLRIEEGTAKFYLDVADGNLKDAIALYGEIGSLSSSATFCEIKDMHACHMHISMLAIVQKSLLYSGRVLLPAQGKQDVRKHGVALQSKTWHGSERIRASDEHLNIVATSFLLTFQRSAGWYLLS